MNAQTLRRLALLLAGLVLVWLGVGLWRRIGRDTDRGIRLTRFDPKAVDQALLAGPTDTLRFAKTAGGWTVNGHPASTATVSDLLNALADTAAQSELVAQSAASLPQLGLDSAGARRLAVLGSGKTLAELLVGKPGDVYGTVLVRKVGEARVYALKGQLGSLVGRPQDDWRDRVIAQVPAESVLAINVQRGKRTYSLKRDGKVWRLGSAPADTAAVARLLLQFRDLDAAGFPTEAQADSARFAPATRAVQLSGAGGRTLVDLRMDSVANTFWVRRAGDSITYRIDAWTADQLAPADSLLRKKR